MLGPLLARFGHARVSLPGGCAIGARPVDQHIKGLQAMGADITVEHGYIVAKATRLKGARITTDMVTVTGTENLLMAATWPTARRCWRMPPRNPEIADLAELLIAMGAQIEGHGTSRIRVVGVERLRAPALRTRSSPTASRQAPSCAPWLPPAATSPCARARPDHLGAVLDKLREAGVSLETGEDWIRVRADSRPRSVGFRTSEYPAFPPTCRPSSWP